jgi:hypothetical protein
MVFMELQINLNSIAITIACLALLVAIIALRRSRLPRVLEPFEIPFRGNALKKAPKQLVSQLDEPARRALEAAAGLAKARTHYFVDLEHWLVRIFQAPGPGLDRVLNENKRLAETIADELLQALSSFPTGNTSIPQLSTGVIDLLSESCVVGGSQFVRSSHLLLTLLTDAELSARIRKTVPSLAKLPVEPLRVLGKGSEKDGVAEN